MKKFIYMLISSVVFISCKDALDIKTTPSLEVTTAKNTYAVNEEIEFLIDGNPKILNFYSGEPLNEYDQTFSDRIVVPEKVLVTFSLRHQYPTRVAGSFHILASADFTGDRASFADVSSPAANWKDVTTRVNIPKTGDETLGYSIDVTDIAEKGKPLSVAFKYVFDPAKGTSGPTEWITLFAVKTVDFLGTTSTLSSTQLNDFLPYSTGNPDKNPIWSDNRTAGQLIMRSNGTTATVNGVVYTNTTYTEEYFVSKPYDVFSETNLGPDKPATLKGYSDSRIKSHKYAFTKPGTYKVVFEGIDHTIKDSKATVKELTLVITE